MGKGSASRSNTKHAVKNYRDNYGQIDWIKKAETETEDDDGTAGDNTRDRNVPRDGLEQDEATGAELPSWSLPVGEKARGADRL